MALGNPLHVAEIDMIIIVYLILLRSDEYAAYKSESTPFHLKDNAFICLCCVFLATAMEKNPQSVNFVTLIFTTHKNGVMLKIGHTESGDHLFCPKADLFC